MSDRAQYILWRVLGDDLNVCMDRDALLDLPSLQGGWDGSEPFEEQLWWWFIDTFVDNRAERERLHRVADAVRGYFINRAQRHYAETGTPVALPEQLIRELQTWVINAMRPSAYETAIGATRQPVATASARLAKLTEEEAWRTKS